MNALAPFRGSRNLLNLDDIGRAEVLNRDHFANRVTCLGDYGQLDQVSVVVLTLFERREGIARNGKGGAAQLLGRGAIRHLGKARDCTTLVVATNFREG